jgi:plasmid stabilization system protein ParE
MKPKWTSKGLSDLTRLYQFLALVNKPAAARAIQVLTNPRIGEHCSNSHRVKCGGFSPGQYEIRYEIRDEAIYVLRLWHTKEDR